MSWWKIDTSLHTVTFQNTSIFFSFLLFLFIFVFFHSLLFLPYILILFSLSWPFLCVSAFITFIFLSEQLTPLYIHIYYICILTHSPSHVPTYVLACIHLYIL
jgi:hypothetical protein